MSDSYKKILLNIGCLNSNKNTTKEVNIVKWDDRKLYIDIRKWTEGISKKGISLNLNEAKKLKDLLNIAIPKLENMLSNNTQVDDFCDFGIEELNDSDIL